MKNSKPRGQFTSSLGFILASAGSAVGLGNLWKFPYVAGSSGGGLFVIFYILFIAVLGIPIMIAEMSIGRSTELNPIGAFQKLNKHWGFVGVIGVITAFIVLSYYSVVGGWVIKYLIQFITSGQFGSNTSVFFREFTSSSVQPVIYHLIFLTFTAIIVIGGISKGIEKVSKIMLPTLLILMVIVAIRSMTLNGAEEGIKFFLMPKIEAFSSVGELGRILVLAMGQVFFSLSLGTGITITYGSYMKKNSDIIGNSFMVAGIDSVVAILSGLVILPAVFALGLTPSAGPGLLFETLPAVFESIPMGRLFGVVFFVLVIFAAITSSISMLEVVCSYLIDRFKFKRWAAAIMVSILMAVTGSFASLSQGVLGEYKIFGMNLFDAMGFLTDKILMPLAGILTCIFIGYIYGVDNIAKEIETGASEGMFRFRKAFSFSMKFLCPSLIFIVFIMGLVK